MQLYAVWRRDIFTISATGQNCTVSGAGNYNRGTTATLTASYDSSKYGFLGWYDANGNCITKSTSLTVNVTNNASYTAKASEIKTITISGNGTVYFWGENGNDNYIYTHNMGGVNGITTNLGHQFAIPSDAYCVRVINFAGNGHGMRVNNGTILFSSNSWTVLTSTTAHLQFIKYSNSTASSIDVSGSVTYQYY